MSNKPAPQSIAASHAAELFAKQQDQGDLSSSEQAALEHYLVENQQLDQLAQCQAAWIMAAELGESENIKAIIKVNQVMINKRCQPPQAETAVSRRGLIGFGVAAALGLGLGFSLLKPDLSPTGYHTEIGESKQVELSDGSIIKLNTNTQLEVHFSAHKRIVKLLHGEALFSVQKDRSRPFEVVSKGTITRAVGTQFNVWLRAANVNVAVLEGVVELERDHIISARISAGQSVSYQKQDFGVVKPMLPARIEAWTRAGQIPFDNTPLVEAVAEFNRYHKKNMVLAPGLEQKRLSGLFSSADRQGFLFALKQGFSVRATDINGQILLQSQ